MAIVQVPISIHGKPLQEVLLQILQPEINISLEAGIYAVTVRDTFNCSVTDTFELTGPDEIVISVETPSSTAGGYNLNCYGDQTAYIRLNASGGVPPDYQYTWQGDTTTMHERYNLAAGEYIVSVSDVLGCTETDTISLTEPLLFGIDSVNLSDYHGFAISCNGTSDGFIDVFSSGGTMDYDYTWTLDALPFAQDTGCLSNLGSGLYAVTMVDANNCQTSWSGVLQEPPVLELNISSTNVNCTGSVLGTASAYANGGNGVYTFDWSHGPSASEISGLMPGEYIVDVSDQNICLITDTVTIVQNTEVHINIQIDDPISCYNLSDGKIRAIATDGVLPYNYSWANGGPATQVYEGLGEGEYSVTVIDNDGCEGQQSIQLSDPEPIKADFEVTDASCYGFSDGFVALNATGGTGTYNYYLNDNLITNDVATDLKAGNHPLYILDAENCETDTLVIVNQPKKTSNHSGMKQPRYFRSVLTGKMAYYRLPLKAEPVNTFITGPILRLSRIRSLNILRRILTLLL